MTGKQGAKKPQGNSRKKDLPRVGKYDYGETKFYLSRAAMLPAYTSQPVRPSC